MLLFTVTPLALAEPTKSQHFVPLVQRSECHTSISSLGTAGVNNFSIFTSTAPHIFLINSIKTAAKLILFYWYFVRYIFINWSKCNLQHV